MDDWSIATWEPGKEVRVVRPGYSVATAWLFTLGIRTPLFVVLYGVAASIAWFLLALAVLIVLLPVFLFYLLVYDTHPPDLVAWAIGAIWAGLAVWCLTVHLRGTVQAWWQGHTNSQEQVKALLWPEQEFRFYRGGCLHSCMRLSKVYGAAVRHGDPAVAIPRDTKATSAKRGESMREIGSEASGTQDPKGRALRFSCIDLLMPESRELLRWELPDEAEVENIETLANQLDQALSEMRGVA
jgi:hypothetical protein